MNIEAMLEQTIENGGGSFNLNGTAVKFSRGYAVSLEGLEKKVNLHSEFFPDVCVIVERYMQANADAIAKPRHFLGLWIEDGTLYMDVSELVINETMARNIARERKQLAYFDFAKGTAKHV